MRNRFPIRRGLLAVAAFALLGSACASSSPELRAIGVKRHPLTLDFGKETDEPAPSTPVQNPGNDPDETSVWQWPDTGGLNVPGLPPGQPPTNGFTPPTFPPPANPCPAASSGQAPRDPVTSTISTPPNPGTYWQHAEGFMALFVDHTFASAFAYPTTPTLTIGAITEGKNDAGEPQVSYEQTKRMGPDYEIHEGIEFDAESIRLVERTVRHGTDEIVFQPTIPVPMINLGDGVNERDWVTTGSDPANRLTVTYEGSVTGVERVDLCGEVYQALRIELWETFVYNQGDGRPQIFGTGPRPEPIRTGEIPETDQEVDTKLNPTAICYDDVNLSQGNTPCEPLVLYLAPHLGGLLLRVEMDDYNELVPSPEQTDRLWAYDASVTLDSINPEAGP